MVTILSRGHHQSPRTKRWIIRARDVQHLAFLAALLPTIFLCYCSYQAIVTYDVIGGAQVLSAGTDQTSTSPGSAIHNAVRQYLDFDEAAPTPILSRTNVLASAVPERRRIPRQHVEDKEYHFHKKTDTITKSIIGKRRGRYPYYDVHNKSEGIYNWDHDFEQDNRALYIQNPSILPLHNTIAGADKDDPDYLSADDLNDITGGDGSVRYLGFFSANLGGKCFGPDDTKLYKLGESAAYYAIALLDENLNDIDSVLIDLNAGPLAWGYKYWFQQTGDCRAVLIKGWIYGLCTEYMLKFKIRRRKPVQGTDNGAHKEHTGQDLNYPYRYPNIYGNGLEVILYSNQRIISGKNYNIFRSASKSDHYLQVFPLPHKYVRLETPEVGKELDHVKFQHEQEATLPIPKPSFSGPDTSNTIITCPENEVKGNKGWVTDCTKPKLSPFFGNNDHGTSCCIALELDGKPVNVGISHQKTKLNTNPWWRQDIRAKYNDKIPGSRYVSRFVAYSVDLPFNIIAVSGWFCLGFEDGGTNDYKLDLFGTYNCPIIHFPSSFTEFVGNSSKAIISYGINDCTHNTIVVEKDEIMRRLVQGK